MATTGVGGPPGPSGDPVTAAPELLPTRRAATGPTAIRALRVGAVGGFVGVFVSITGMVERFNGSSIITGVITLGPAMLYITMVVTGYLASRDRLIEGVRVRLSAGHQLLSGVVAGAAFGALMAGFVLLFNAVNLRRVFVNLSPTLVGNILTFGREPALGALLILGVAVGLGLLGSGLRFVPQKMRRALIAGLVALLLVGVLEQLIRVMLANLNLETSWLYTRGGLNNSGAVITFGLGFGLTLLVASRETILDRLGSRPGRSSGQGEEGASGDDAGAAERRETVAMGLGLASLALSVTLAVLGLLQVPFHTVLLLAALLAGFVAIGVAAVVSRGRTGVRRVGRAGIGFFAATAGIFAIVPLLVGIFLSQTLVTVGVYVLLAVGLNIVVGYAGLLDLGYVAFFAVGAYTTGLLISRQSSLVTEGVGEFGAGSQQPSEHAFTNFWAALPIVIVVAVIIGILIGAPVLRLRGDYLAIVTLGFGEIVRVVVASDWAAPILGGSQGIKQITPPPPADLNFRNPQNLYYVVLVFVLFAVYVSHRLQYSRTGRAWAAMREDEDVAEAMGISVIKYKLLAFAIGAGVGCLSGAFFAVNLSAITPNSFRLLVSITVLSAIILGGIGNIPGVIVGAAFLVGLPELLREFQEYRLLFYGAILVAIMILRPEGLIPSAQRRRELHEIEAEEVQFEKRVGAASPAPAVTGGAGEDVEGPEGGR
ncbi:MAG: branched-chain amino acid ABC transporter permease [Actinomycetota bacterium]